MPSPTNTTSSRCETLARRLLQETIDGEQTVYELQLDDDPLALRAHIRLLARRRSVKIRTGLVSDTVVVILLDAALWSEPAKTMRDELTPASSRGERETTPNDER